MVELHRRSMLAQIEQTISMSEIRCLPFDEILRRLETLWSDSQSGQLVFRLCEEKLSHNQLMALSVSVQRLAEAVDALPSALKASPDRAIRRILSAMPPEIAAPIAVPWVEHSRKFRREVAYRILRDSGLTAATGKALFDAFQRTGDQECLHLIARHPIALTDIAAATVLPLIDDDYWRMRLAQATLIADREGASALMESYPREFLHAIGRLKDISLIPEARQLFEGRSTDLQFISLYAWVLGQLGATDDLKALKSHVATLKADGHGDMTEDNV